MSNIGFAGNIKSADGSARKAGFGTNRWQRQLFLADLQLFPAVNYPAVTILEKSAIL